MNDLARLLNRAAGKAYEGALRDVLRESSQMFSNDEATQGLVRMLIERVKDKHT